MSTAVDHQPLIENVIESLRVNHAGAGETQHPSRDVDDHTHPYTPGAHARLQSEDMKRRSPRTVDSVPDEVYRGGSGRQSQFQTNLGVQSSATGEDPEVEDDYKGTKDDPGTSHPADAEEIGAKYSAYMEMPFGDLAVAVADGNNHLLSRLIAYKAASAYAATNTAANYQQQQQQQHQSQPTLSSDGYNLIVGTVRDAHRAGEKVAEFFYDRLEQLKQAADLPPGVDGPPPGVVGPPPGMDGPPPGMDGPPPGDGGGDPIQELLAVCRELGIDPEELAAAARAGGGPGAAIAPEDAPGVAAKAAAAAAMGRELHNAGYDVWTPVVNQKQAQLRRQIYDFVREVMGR